MNAGSQGHLLSQGLQEIGSGTGVKSSYEAGINRGQVREPAPTIQRNPVYGIKDIAGLKPHYKRGRKPNGERRTGQVPSNL